MSHNGTAAPNGAGIMQIPSLGQLRFAQALFASERIARRRRANHDATWNRLFDVTVVMTFFYFLLM